MLAARCWKGKRTSCVVRYAWSNRRFGDTAVVSTRGVVVRASRYSSGWFWTLCSVAYSSVS